MRDYLVTLADSSQRASAAFALRPLSTSQSEMPARHGLLARYRPDHFIASKICTKDDVVLTHYSGSGLDAGRTTKGSLPVDHTVRSLRGGSHPLHSLRTQIRRADKRPKKLG